MNALILRPMRAAPALLCLAALALAGCQPRPGGTRATAPTAGREILITEADIERMSVRTAWDAVRLRAPRFSAGVDEAGRPSRVRIQAPQSVNADETPLLVVNGLPVADIMYLQEIPASDVHAIHILTGEVAGPIYGLQAAGGAIVVETKQGQ